MSETQYDALAAVEDRRRNGERDGDAVRQLGISPAQHDALPLVGVELHVVGSELLPVVIELLLVMLEGGAVAIPRRQSPVIAATSPLQLD